MRSFLTCLFLVLLFLITVRTQAQIRGTITQLSGIPLSAVTISVQGTYTATSSNSMGQYELKAPNTSSIIIVFQRLGFKTKTVALTGSEHPVELDVVLEEEVYSIEEVLIRNLGNPADNLIRKTIAHRDNNADARDKFEADFYSKGSLSAINLPKKILGAKLEDDKQLLDSSGSGILYLSETISRILVDRPNKMKETILASKVSGENQGFSFNRAQGTEFDLYSNFLDLGTAKIISPIADQAFSYYRYRLLGSFEEEGQLIFKIAVEAKRKSEPVVEGELYIVEGTWQVYGLDFVLLGSSINQPVLDTLFLTQQYTYNRYDRLWSKQLQTLDFKAGIMGLRFKGHFTHTFTNYIYVERFEQSTFGQINSEFKENANSQDESYWAKNRKVPLAEDEITDYHRRDSIAAIINSPHYIDSIDRLRSTFKIKHIFFGYHYQDTPRKLALQYQSPLSLFRTSFNTVQGFNFKTSLSATVGDAGLGARYSVGVHFNYGLADKRLYTHGDFKMRFNTITYATLALSGGTTLNQFNADSPISPFLNSVYSLFLGDNYMKLYQSQFIRAGYQEYLTPNLQVKASLGYFRRSNVFNNTSYTFSSTNSTYTANNPLAESDFDLPAFQDHALWKAALNMTIHLKTSIDKKPNRLDYTHSSAYPTIDIGFSNAFASSFSTYNYQELILHLRQQMSIGNKGLFAYALTTGTYFNAKDIAFTDYRHFNGNQTHIGTSSQYLNNFLTLPYYSHSTNKSFVELHAEHNFKGYWLNKIPIVNRLQLQTVVGYHLLSTINKKPYQEFSVGLDNIGWGKYRLFRVDYVRTSNGIRASNAIMVGAKFLNIIR
ncbi:MULTISPECIES: DUF5686 family protein [Sphingobacterium]|uniref:DUF5686 family protein n=1 Tax=Sphingobacterium TaxID=28453 RepID=UPI0013DC778D|nr:MULTISPECIES: DUF5686 family protein [unclassified Sphingobacterium]